MGNHYTGMPPRDIPCLSLVQVHHPKDGAAAALSPVIPWRRSEYLESILIGRDCVFAVTERRFLIAPLFVAIDLADFRANRSY